MSLYEAIADHITYGRAPDLDARAFEIWLSNIDNGADATWSTFDDLLEEFEERYRIMIARQHGSKSAR